MVEYLGPDAGPLMAALKDCLDKKIDKDSPNKAHVECRQALQKAVQKYESGQ